MYFVFKSSNHIHTGLVFALREKSASKRSLTPSISREAVPSGVDQEVILSWTLRGSLP